MSIIISLVIGIALGYFGRPYIDKFVKKEEAVVKEEVAKVEAKVATAKAKVKKAVEKVEAKVEGK